MTDTATASAARPIHKTCSNTDHYDSGGVHWQASKRGSGYYTVYRWQAYVPGLGTQYIGEIQCPYG